MRLHILVILTLLTEGVCLPAVHTVSEDQLISETLERAKPGDTVLLKGREYQEVLVIDVPVHLKGEGMPMVRGGYKGTVVHVRAPGTILEGIHIAESGIHLTKDMAAVLVEADEVQIKNCVISESLHGIYLKGADLARISENTIRGRKDLIEADRGNGIHLWNSSENHIWRNEIVDVRDGIYFSFAHQTVISENHISNVRYGLHYMYSNENSFEDNLFERNVAGAALMYSENIVFSRNVFARCRGFRSYGILLQSVSSIRAQWNLVLDNSRGVFMNNSDSNRIENNDIVDNDLAVQLNGGCDNNCFVGNNFINNLSDLLLDVSDKETRWSDSSGGNYWSGYTGYDLDRDDIGDVAFNIQNVFQVMEADVPEVRFYLFSAAAEVLRVAEQTLPILNLGDAQDPRPLMKPASNTGVPWLKVEGLSNETGKGLWALAFLVGSLIAAGAVFGVFGSRR